jgi:hypothetical protein
MAHAVRAASWGGLSQGNYFRNYSEIFLLTAETRPVKVCGMNFISLLDMALLAAGIGLTAGGIIGLVGALWALAEHWWRESHE